MSAITLNISNVTKTFPGVKALDGVSMRLSSGSIHALMGENGAGKSTLIKIITGVHRPDSGRVELDGKEVSFESPRDAIASHIGVVHQERNLIPRFSVAENIHLDRLAAFPFRPIDYRKLNAAARVWLDELGLDIDPALPVSRLNVAKMQMVEIAKALSLRSRVLLLDEPTASLTDHETEVLFRVLRKLRDAGTSLLFVSHKLEEVQEICDSITVLRDGRNASESRSMEGLGRQDIVRMMIGRAEDANAFATRDLSAQPVALELDRVSTELGHSDISLKVRAGEIVGLYGLVGAGRTELAKCIMGQHRITAGEMRIKGKVERAQNPADAIHRLRIGYISEDRKQEGLILAHSVLENAGITVWRQLTRGLAPLTNRAIRGKVEPFIRQLEVKTPSLDQRVGLLSGGNQQKISVAKWLAAGTDILIIDEPSVGIDIKTKAYLHDLIRDLARKGVAVVLITSDMPEMIALADRIAVLADNRLRGELLNTGRYDVTSQEIMNLIHAVPA